MAKERKALTWEGNNEEVRRLFTLTPDDLYFLHPLRADSQRLYRALVLVWARVERVLLSETTGIPEGVIKQVSTQLGLSPALLVQQRNYPSMRSATFEAVRTYLGVRAFQETDEGRLRAYLMEKVTHTGNFAALSQAAMDWLVSEGILRPHGETTLERLIYQARNQAEDVLFEQIAGQLSSEDRERLDHLRLGGQLNDSIIQRVQGFGTDQLSPSDEGGIIGHTTEIDAAKPAEHQAIIHPLLRLLKTPLIQMLGDEQTQDDFHGCRVTTTQQRSGMPPRQVCLNLAEEEILIEESIQMSEHRIGLGCSLGNSSKHIFFSIAVNKHLALLLCLDFLGDLALCLRFAASLGWGVDT